MLVSELTELGLAREPTAQVIPGPVGRPSAQVEANPHIAAALSRALGLYVVAGNDSSVGAMGEFVFGAAKEVTNLVYVNGTARGIGGGIIVGGTLLSGTEGYAGELGDTLVNSQGSRCHCGRIGCLETEVNLERLLPYLGRTQIDEDDLDIALGVGRDPALLLEVSRQADLLSEALTNFVNLFSPEMVFEARVPALEPMDASPT